MSHSHGVTGWRVLVILTIVILAQSALTSIVSAESGSCVYVVQRGDTLFSIARRFGTTVDAIADANCLCNPNRIFAGQRLLIPARCEEACERICEKVCETGCEVCGVSRVHIVRPGETLTRIAVSNGTTVTVLMRLNGICNPNLIFVGQCLRIS